MDEFVVFGSLYEEINTTTHFQIQHETLCLSHNVNTFRKGINPIILPPDISNL